MWGFDPVSKIRTMIDTVWLCAASAALRPCLRKARAHSLEQVRNGQVHRLGKIQPVPWHTSSRQVTHPRNGLNMMVATNHFGEPTR